MKYPLKIAVIGMGGYAGVHHDSLMRLEKEGVYRLVGACDPEPAKFVDQQQNWRLEERGVRVFDDYLAMLDACADELDVATIPTPIHLHAPMHRACVERGLAVYLEKPPTLDYAELERMIEVDAQARHQTMVGFNFIVEPERQKLKSRLVAGEFGPVKSAGVYALWPRDTNYYQRADWAGRLKLGDRLVLDSCIGNAMAHQVHNILFWSGAEGQDQWAQPQTAAAEMYRAHSIEGADTIFIKCQARNGVEVRVAMSHACMGRGRHEECVCCEGATLRWHLNHSGVNGASYTITWQDGRIEYGIAERHNLNDLNLTAYAEYLTGRRRRPPTNLTDSRPFVHLNNLAYLAAGRIVPIPRDLLVEQGGMVEVPELPESALDLVCSGRLPSVQNRRPWAQPGGSAEMDDLPKLCQVVDEMAAGATPALAGT